MKAIVLRNGIILTVDNSTAKAVMVAISEDESAVFVSSNTSGMPDSLILCNEVIAICDVESIYELPQGEK